MLKEIAATTCLASSLLCNSHATEMKKFTFNATPAKQVRVLSVGFYPAQRDAVDLANRLKMKLDIAGVSSIYNKGADLKVSTFYWPALCGMNNDEAAEIVRNKLKKNYDLILLTSLPKWSKYPADIRDNIIGKVQNGTVIVAFSPERNFLEQFDQKKFKKLPAPLNTYKPIDSKDYFAPELYSYGKGYIAVCRSMIDYRLGFLFKMSGEYMDYEYRFARIARLFHNLIRRSNGEIISLEVDSQTTQIKLQNKLNGKLNLTVCDNEGNIEKVISREIDKSLSNHNFELPYLPNGRHFIFLNLTDSDNHTLDWTAKWFMVKNSYGIKSLKISPAVTEKDAILTIDMEGIDELSKPHIELTVSDTWDRICLRKKQYENCNEIKFKAPANSCTVINRAKVDLYNEGKLIDTKTVDFSIPSNVSRQDFYLFAWNSSTAKTRRHKVYFDALKKAGLDGFTNMAINKINAKVVAEANLIGIPYTTQFHNLTLADNLFNPQWVDKMAKRAGKTAKNFKPYGGFAFTLGDENYVSGFKPAGRFGDIPLIWQMFQNYLQKEYHSLDKLNAQWESSYKSWKDISFKDEKELLKKFGNPSPWTDFRMFISARFINIQKRIRDIIKKTCPNSYVGWDGCEQYSSYDGYDWWDYVTEFDLNNIYSRYLLEGGYGNKIFNGSCVKSFAEKTHLKGAWLNSVNPTFGAEYYPWNLLFNGFNSVWWWTATFTGKEVQAFDPYFTPTPIFAKAAEQVKIIKKGPATLLKHARPVSSKIAIHYSANNWHASTLSSGIGGHINNLGVNNELWFSQDMPGRYIKSSDEFKELWKGTQAVGHYAAASQNVINIVKDLGLNPVSVARQQIEAGILGNYKVLFLPFVESLSKREVKEIKKFVKNGGTVIADYRCGIRDFHCKFRKQGALDDIFGIKQTGKFKVLKKRRKSTIDDCRRLAAELDIIFSQPDLKLTTGKANGINDDGSPAFIINDFGKGKALYCNFDLYAYSNSRLKEQEAPMRELFAQFLMDAGGFCREPRARRNDGNLAGQIRMYKYTDGEAFYLGFSRDFVSPQARIETLNIPFPKTGHIYEVRSKRYFGYGNSIKVKMRPGEVALFAVLPYQPETPKITGYKSAKLGSILDFKIKVPPNNKQGTTQPATISIEIFDPSDNKRSYLSKVIYLGNGQGNVKVPLALNDPIGQWKIKATETVSGKTSFLAFVVAK